MSTATRIPANALASKRILVAKPGLDGHDVGAKVIAIALRDAGAEVIYTGLRKTPEYIVRVALDEDVDAIGLSILSGSHVALVEETVRLLRRNGLDDVKVFVGGTIPREDWPALREAGAVGIFTSEMELAEVVNAVATELTR